jgi:hypothetical protein
MTITPTRRAPIFIVREVGHLRSSASEAVD